MEHLKPIYSTDGEIFTSETVSQERKISKELLQSQDNGDEDGLCFEQNSLTPLKHASAEEINGFLQNFWEYFHPIFPILHQGTFVVPETFESNALFHIMCAIGARYNRESKDISDECFTYCVDFLDRHLAKEEEMPIDVFQAGLLAGYTGLFWGSSELYKWSSRTIYLLIMVARENGMFQHVPPATETDWKLFLELELVRRNSYALFFIDGQMSTLLNNPPKMSHYEIKHILPCDDDLWQALTEEEWRNVLLKLKLSDSTSSSSDDGLAATGQFSKGHTTHAPGVYFLEALQQTLICGNAPSETSSFGGMILLLAIHIMIRNMTQFAGLLETCYALAQDPYSRRSQLGNALDGLRFLIPRSPRIDKNGRHVKGMWGLFEATLHLALIHLHLPDTAITSGIVEPDLAATIATAAALTQPQSIIPPGTAFLGNEIHNFPYETLALVTGHTTFFLKTFNQFYKETNPLLTFMFYKVSLVTWLVLRSLIQRTETRLAKEKRRLSSNSNPNAPPSPPDPKELRKEFMLKHLAVEILSHVELSDNFNDIGCYESCMINRLNSYDTWGVGVCGAMSFKDMLTIGESQHSVRN